MSLRTISCGAILALMAYPCVAVPEGLDDSTLLHYQKFVQDQDTGVYEYAGVLYFQVKLPFDRKKDHLKEKRLEALLAANDLMRQWAIDFSRPERERRDPSPSGIKFAKQIAASYLPEWQFREWAKDFSMRECPHKTDEGFYVVGQIVSKDALVRNIPRAFFEPYAQNDWDDALSMAVKRGRSVEGRESVVSKCGAWDALENSSGCTNVEYVAVCREVSAYLESSATARRIRESRDRIEAEVPEASYFDTNPCVDVTTNISFQVQTNALSGVSSEEQVTTEPQTDESKTSVGRSFGTNVEVSKIFTDVEEHVETRIEVVTMTRRCVRRLLRSKSKGFALFERMFLSQGSSDCEAVGRTALGRIAEKEFFAPSNISRKKLVIEDALRENPADVGLWNLYGKCLAVEGDVLGAIVCFRVALRINGDYEFALVNLAEAYASLGRERLSVGLATYACAIASDKWCVEHAKALLSK